MSIIKKLLKNEQLSDLYEDFRKFSDGLAAVKRNGLWGFIDENGYEVITCKFEEVSDFKKGTAKAKANGFSFDIDRNGRRVKTFNKLDSDRITTVNQWMKEKGFQENLKRENPTDVEIFRRTSDMVWLTKLYCAEKGIEYSADAEYEEFYEKFEDLIKDWAKIISFPVGVDSVKQLPEGAAIFDYIQSYLPRGFELRHSASFANSCAQFLAKIYRLGVEDEADMQRAITLIRTECSIEFLKGNLKEEIQEWASTELPKVVIADLSSTVKGIQSGRVKDEFNSYHYDV